MANEYGFHEDKAIYPLSELVDDIMPQVIEHIGNVILDRAYPVGSVYISFTDDNPAETLGGEWEQVEDRFLLAAGEMHLISDEPGGEERVTLLASECGVPAHTHPNNLSVSVNSHNHTQNGATIKWLASIGKGKKPSGGTGHLIPALAAASTDNSWQVTTSTGGNALKTDGATATTKKTGGVQSNSAANAASSHNNMPPYIVVYMWRRVA